MDENKKTPANAGGSGMSFGFSPAGYNQIILFTDEGMFQTVMAANPHMTAIVGADDHTKKEFPGVFLAGVKTSPQTNRAETELLQLLSEETLKEIGEHLADIVRQYDLQRSPDVCRKLFSYMADVVESWNCV